MQIAQYCLLEHQNKCIIFLTDVILACMWPKMAARRNMRHNYFFQDTTAFTSQNLYSLNYAVFLDFFSILLSVKIFNILQEKLCYAVVHCSWSLATSLYIRSTCRHACSVDFENLQICIQTLDAMIDWQSAYQFLQLRESSICRSLLEAFL